MVEVAIATRTAPAQWWDEPPEVVLTAVDVLERRAAEAERASRRRRG